jgi:hypothetical protein
MFKALTHLVDRLEHKLHKAAFAALFVCVRPLLCFRIEESITPQVLHEFVDLNAKLVGIHFGELFERERPSVQTRAKTDIANGRVNLRMGLCAWAIDYSP